MKHPATSSDGVITLLRSKFLKKCCLALPRLTLPPPPLLVLATILLQLILLAVWCCVLWLVNTCNQHTQRRYCFEQTCESTLVALPFPVRRVQGSNKPCAATKQAG